MIVNVYDDMVVFERHEVNQGGKLGPDWVMPLGEYKPHPFTREELKNVIGEPQFGKKAKLVVEKGRDGVPPPSAVAGGTATLPGIRIKIPNADGNPDCCVYGYQIVVAGEDKTAALKKNCYARGYCMGMDGEGPYPRESGIVQICSGVARRYMVEYPIVSLVGYSRRPCQGGII